MMKGFLVIVSPKYRFLTGLETQEVENPHLSTDNSFGPLIWQNNQTLLLR